MVSANLRTLSRSSMSSRVPPVDALSSLPLGGDQLAATVELNNTKMPSPDLSPELSPCLLTPQIPSHHQPGIISPVSPVIGSSLTPACKHEIQDIIDLSSSLSPVTPKSTPLPITKRDRSCSIELLFSQINTDPLSCASIPSAPPLISKLKRLRSESVEIISPPRILRPRKEESGHQQILTGLARSGQPCIAP